MTIAYPYNNSKILDDYKNDININELIKKMIIAEQSNKAFESIFTVYSKGDIRDGKHTGIDREFRIKAKLYFKNPLNVLLKVIDSTDIIAKGSTLLYTGGEKVKVKAGGLLGLITVYFNVNSPIFQNTRGHNLLMTLEGLKRISHSSSKLKILGRTKIDNRNAYVLEVDAYQKPDPEITKELFYVDTQNYIVLCNEMYEGNDLVFQYKLDYINTNVNLNASLFKL